MRPQEPEIEPEPDSEAAAEREPERLGRQSPRRKPEEVTGVLDRMPQGYGFLRLSGLSEAEGDVYVSAVADPPLRAAARRSRDGPRPGAEARRAPPALVRVEAVNGQSPEEKRTRFEDLTPAPPHRRLLPPDAPGDALVRAVDLLGPLAFGQRVLVLAEPRSGRTTLLRALGSAIADTGAHICVLLADERPRRSRSGSGPCRRPRSSRPPRIRSRAIRSTPPSWRWGAQSGSPRAGRTSSSWSTR